MTKVQISETYAVGCAECAAQLHRLVQWSARDPQVTGLTFKTVPRCEHALPAIAGGRPKPTSIARAESDQEQNASTESHPQSTPPPTPSAGLFAVADFPDSTLAGTGYDEAAAMA